MKKRTYELVLFMVVIAIVSFVLRCYKLNASIADWHSWRQADTAAVARNFIKSGIDLLHPRYDDLSNIQTGKDNPEGYRMVEFPVYQMTAALVAAPIPQVPIERVLRILSIIASTLTGLLLGFLIARRINSVAGMLTSFLYAVLPYSIYYGRSILPEVHAVFWSIVSICLMDRVFEEEKKKKKIVLFLLASIVSACAVLIKPTAGFLLLPVLGFAIANRKNLITNMILLVVYAIISLVPFYLWRSWIAHYPEGIPVYMWLLNGNSIRFKGAWFYWLFAERIGKILLGYWGLVFLGLGLTNIKDKNEKGITFWLLVGALLYMVIFATGNVQHDYYQIIILPAITVLTGSGMAWFFEKKPIRIPAIILGLVSFFFMLSFSWYTVRTFYWINRPEIVEAGIAADKMIPKDAQVIAPYNGDTSFLYQTNRRGWPIGFEIDKKIQMGATHYVTVSPGDTDGETKELARKYTVLVRNEKFAIIDLTKQK